MSERTPINFPVLAFSAAVALSLAGCGDDSTTSASTDATSDTSATDDGTSEGSSNNTTGTMTSAGPGGTDSDSKG